MSTLQGSSSPHWPPRALCSSCAIALLTGCSQRPLDELLAREASSAELGAATPGLPLDGDPAEYFPLRSGLSWTYVHTNPEQGSRRETTTVAQAAGTATEFEVTTLRSDTNAVDLQRWHWAGPQLLRNQRVESIGTTPQLVTRYEPGWLRFSLDWNGVGAEVDSSYLRTETEPGGAMIRSERAQHFRVLAVDANVRVPFGELGPCLVVERTGDGDRTLVWFARHVGRVRELDEDTQVTEEMVQFVEQ